MSRVQADLNMNMKCIKYMLFVANFMFVMVGFLLISIGSTVTVFYDDFDGFLKESFFSPAKLTIAVGIIIFFVAFFGCIGAIKESTFLINTYAFLMTLTLILEVSASIAAYAMRSNLETNISNKMNASLEKYKGNVDDYYSYTWDSTQELLSCCGVNNPTEWNTYLATQEPSSKITLVQTESNGNILVPTSCCKHFTPDKRCTIYERGCLNRLTSIVSECALLLGIGTLSVAFIQLVGIIFACTLAKSIRQIKTQQLVERQRVRQQIADQLINQQPIGKVTPVLYTPETSEA